MPQTSQEIDRAQEQILDYLQKHGSAVDPSSVTSEIKGLGIDESLIRAAIWFLLDRHKISLTSNLQLLAVK
jgi:DNA-binding transcriptional regulator PaaX